MRGLGSIQWAVVVTALIAGGIEAGPQYSNTPFKEEGGDAPTHVRVVPGEDGLVPMLAWIKDANEAPTTRDFLRFEWWDGAIWQLIWSDETDRSISDDQRWTYLQFPLSLVGSPPIDDSLLVRVRMRIRDCPLCVWKDLEYRQKVKVGEKLPRIPGWYIGDLHRHTHWSDDVVHFGEYLGFVPLSGKALDHDFVCITDHSPDVTNAEWQQLDAGCAAGTDSRFIMLPGLEITAASQDGRVHLTAYGLTRNVPAGESCCTDNVGLWPLGRVLDSLSVQGAVGMAAHPQTSNATHFGNLTAWGPGEIATAMMYPRSVFAGFEFLNERPTMNPADISEEYWDPHPFFTPKPNWDQFWIDGHVQFQTVIRDYPDRPVALAGGSDAHGDNNFKGRVDNSGNTVADDASYGRVWSLIYSPYGFSRNGVINGIKAGAMVGSDGPAFVFTVDVDGDGNAEGTIGETFNLTPNARFRLEGKSIAEFGNFTHVRIFRTTPAGTETTTVAVSGLALQTTNPAFGFVRPDGKTAVHMEARTSRGYRAITSPVYLEPQSTTDVGGELLAGLAMSAPRPNPSSGNTVFTVTLPTAGDIVVEVMDLGGRLVRRMSAGPVPAGQHALRWDGCADDDEPVPTGLYFLRLRGHGSALSRKLIIAR